MNNLFDEQLTVDLWYALVGGVIVALALYTFIANRHLLKRLLAFNVMGSGVFLIMVGLAQHGGEPDAVPQALVLTGIVVAVSATALALVLLRRYLAAGGAPFLPEEMSSAERRAQGRLDQVLRAERANRSGTNTRGPTE